MTHTEKKKEQKQDPFSRNSETKQEISSARLKNGEKGLWRRRNFMHPFVTWNSKQNPDKISQRRVTWQKILS